MILEQELLENNTVCIFGKIDDDMVYRVIKQLMSLQHKFQKNLIANPTIIIAINSSGGNMAGALSIYDMIKAMNCNVVTVCMGLAESAASIILAGGTKGFRYTLKNSEILIHHRLCDEQGEMDDVIIKERRLKTKKILNEVLAEETGQELSKVKFDSECNYYLSSVEAKEYGVVDKVINEFSEIYNDVPYEISKINIKPLDIETEGDCSYDYDNDEESVALLREELDKRKDEIIKRLKNDVLQKKDNGLNLKDELTEDVENAIDCMSTLYPNELDLIGASIGNGYISERWIKKYAYCGEVSPMSFIEHFLKLGIVEKVSNNIYKYLFSLETFEKARKKL